MPLYRYRKSLVLPLQPLPRAVQGAGGNLQLVWNVLHRLMMAGIHCAAALAQDAGQPRPWPNDDVVRGERAVGRAYAMRRLVRMVLHQRAAVEDIHKLQS